MSASTTDKQHASIRIGILTYNDRAHILVGKVTVEVDILAAVFTIDLTVGALGNLLLGMVFALLERTNLTLSFTSLNLQLPELGHGVGGDTCGLDLLGSGSGGGAGGQEEEAGEGGGRKLHDCKSACERYGSVR